MASSFDATIPASDPSARTSREATPKVRLEAKDGELFVVDLPIAKQMIDNITGALVDVDLAASNEPIPLPNVSAPILQKVITFMEYHYNNDGDLPEKPDDDLSHFTDEICKWDKEFIDVDQGTLFEILVASNYLNNKKMRTVACKTIAEALKQLTVEQIREKYNTENDFTSEEIEAIRKENEFCEESD